MSRYPKSLFGPAGICDACGQACSGLHQVGAQCYHSACRKGVFRRRSEWEFVPCKACRETGFLCGVCHGIGLIATRKPGFIGSEP